MSDFSRPQIQGIEIYFLSKRNPNNIPSYFWYNFVNKVSNISERHWSYLKNTAIKIVDLSLNKIGPHDAVAFSLTLQGTCVHTVSLKYNSITDARAVDFFKNLQKTQVHTVYLRNNPIDNYDAIDVGHNLNAVKINMIK